MDLAGPDLVPPVPGLFLEPATVASTVVHRDDPDLDHHELDGLDLDDEDGIAANGQPGPRRRRRRRGGRGRSAGTQTADVALPGGLDDPIERQAESA